MKLFSIVTIIVLFYISIASNIRKRYSGSKYSTIVFKEVTPTLSNKNCFFGTENAMVSGSKYLDSSLECLPGYRSTNCKTWKMTNAIILKSNENLHENGESILNFFELTSSNCTSTSQVQWILPSNDSTPDCSFINNFNTLGLKNAIQNFNYSRALVPDKNDLGNSMYNLLESTVKCMNSQPPKLFDGAILNVFTDMTYIDLCESDNFIRLFPNIIETLKDGGYNIKIIFLKQSLIDDQANVETVLNGCKYNVDKYFCEIIDSTRMDDPSNFEICLKEEDTKLKNLNIELLLIIGIPCVSLTICCITLIVCCLKCAQLKAKLLQFKFFGENGNEANFDGRRFRRYQYAKKDHDRKNNDGWAHASSSNNYTDINSLAHKKDVWEIDPKNLLLQEDHLLGNGAFSNVYKGIVKGKIPLFLVNNSLNLNLESENNGHFDAAIKKLPAHADEQNHIDFFHEIEFMKKLGHHPHIVSMLGCITNPYDPLIVVEYCARGDLLKFLRRHKDYVLMNKTDECPIHADVCIRIKDLVSFAWQIADGMTYLSSKNFIHRDLAARNVLLTKNMSAKISDFGLCRYMDSALYTAKGGRLPIKWMPIEALKLYEFSSKSDVWSFGVLLYEIFSLGDVPYPTVQQMDMLEHLQSGNRLPQPLKCPNEIYSLMQKCWLENAENRPEFNDIRGDITMLLNLDDESYGYLNLESDDGIPKHKCLTMQQFPPQSVEPSGESVTHIDEQAKCHKLTKIMSDKYGPEQAHEIKQIICEIFPKID